MELMYYIAHSYSLQTFKYKLLKC